MSKLEYRPLEEKEHWDGYTWAPQIYFQFFNVEANQRFNSHPEIDWDITERSLYFF